MMSNWSGKRVLILGAARQGLALARWLRQHGTHVILSDQRSSDELSAARASLADMDIEWALGGHPLELLERVDVICLSGGIPLDLPIVKEAIQTGIPLSNDTQIFMEAAPCRTIGITGSAGKTTTTTLVGQMAQLAFKQDGPALAHPLVYVGGNIGDPLINYVDRMKAADLAILEISSFQLDQMSRSPTIAAVLNITPNHLDRHQTMDAYTTAKARILKFQTGKDLAILSRDDPGAWDLHDQVKGKLLAFSNQPLEDGLDGAYLQNGLLNLRAGAAYLPLITREKIHLRGEHNLSNVLAAFTIGQAAGFSLDAMLSAVENFRGVAHRLELVRELHGVRWYNDSIATTPERSMAAIRSFEEPLVLLLGGRDKHLPWDRLVDLVHERVDHVVLFGEAAEKIGSALGKPSAGQKPFSLDRDGDLKAAVLRAAEVAEPGDVVLLSPGGTSFDAFTDFEQRGECFRTWVQELS